MLLIHTIVVFVVFIYFFCSGRTILAFSNRPPLSWLSAPRLIDWSHISPTHTPRTTHSNTLLSPRHLRTTRAPRFSRRSSGKRFCRVGTGQRRRRCWCASRDSREDESFAAREQQTTRSDARDASDTAAQLKRDYDALFVVVGKNAQCTVRSGFQDGRMDGFRLAWSSAAAAAPPLALWHSLALSLGRWVNKLYVYVYNIIAQTAALRPERERARSVKVQGAARMPTVARSLELSLSCSCSPEHI